MNKLSAIFMLLAGALLTQNAYPQTRNYKENEDILRQIKEYNQAEKSLEEAAPGEESEKEDNEKDKKKKAENPGADSALLKTGLSLFNSGSYDGAAKNLNELVSAYPQSPYADTARIWLGKIYVKKYEYAKAIQELSAIPETSGEYPAARFDTAFCLKSMGDTLAAISGYQTIATRFPNHELADKALLRSGILFAEIGKGSEAASAFFIITSRYSDRETVDDALFYLAAIFEKDPELRDIERARDIYKLFLKKSAEGEPHFKDSPLKEKAARELKRIEEIYFKIKQ
ncbi:MAG: tetratricopeptide repeat protein [Leptospirales bacterium]|nr:tetratricopeptide repeat protein [Leptospirales bacterium]